MKKIFNFIEKRFIILSEKIINSFFLLNNNLGDYNNIFTHLTISEKRKLFELSSKVENGYIVEIGSFVGASACFISEGMGQGTKLICIDTWGNDAMSEGKRNTEKEFDSNTKSFQPKIIKVQGYSTEVIDKIKKVTESIDLLFIDGDHSYEGCKKDWDLYSPYLKGGSCVVFHDCGWAGGVVKVIEEDAKPIMTNFNSLPNMFWGYIK